MPKKPSNNGQALAARFARVKLLLNDVDGILTDSMVWMGRDAESKRFCVMDGLGVRLLRENGIKVGWISGRPSAATEQRARELEIDFLHQSRGNKVAVAEEMMAQAGVKWPDVCYMGDDIVDLGVLKRARAWPWWCRTPCPRPRPWRTTSRAPTEARGRCARSWN